MPPTLILQNKGRSAILTPPGEPGKTPWLFANPLFNFMIDAALPPLIQQMMQPEFYSHPVQTPVELVQTHVSYVLLTGEIAYKLKKPVNFGFLDYSTLEKRHHFCQEELRLNQRAAAPVYLEVVPIVKNGDRFQLGQGEAVEYAVKMRQFPQSALLSRQFEQGELTETLLQRLALTVAEFHAQAETSPYIRSFGEVAQVRAAIDENYEQTTGFIGGPQTQAQFDQTQAYSDRFFEQEQTLFQRRIDQDRIRPATVTCISITSVSGRISSTCSTALNSTSRFDLLMSCSTLPISLWT